MTFRQASISVIGVALIGAAAAATDVRAVQQKPQPPRAPAVLPPVRDGAAVARPIETGTGSIAGVVRSTDPELRPIRRARVSLARTEQGSLLRLIVATDDQGRFQFVGLPPGRYRINAALPGWVTGEMGARGPGGQGMTLALTEGQTIRDVTIAMARGAVITGRVADMAGQPVVAARVLASERRIVNGAVSFQSGFAGLGSVTDDRGVYRLFGLKAGTYAVSATPPPLQTPAARVVTQAELQWVAAPRTPGSSQTPPPPPGPMSTYAQVFHPSATDVAGASLISVGAGEERDGVDITLQLVPTVKVSGTVTRPDGQRAAGAQVVVAPLDQPMLDPLALLFRNISPRNTPNGEFSFLDLQPGRYTISARAPSAAGPSAAGGAGTPGGRGAPPPILDLWATAEITVSGTDIEGLSLALQPGMTMSGRVVFEGTTPAPDDLSRVSVRLTAPPTSGGLTITSGTTSNVVSANGKFSIRGLSPGAYELNASAPGLTAGMPTWTLKSAVAGGRTLLDSPIEIHPGGDLSDVVVTFTDRVTEVTGLLLDRAGRPAPEFYVIVFPTDASRWTQRARWLRLPTRPASDGRFRITGLPPGEFYLAALTEFDQNEWWTPAFLEQVVPGAIRITIGEGEKKVQDVRLGI